MLERWTHLFWTVPMTPFPTLSLHDLESVTGGRQHRRPGAPTADPSTDDTRVRPDAGRTAASYRKPLRLF